jgi:hypothetical protein
MKQFFNYKIRGHANEILFSSIVSYSQGYIRHLPAIIVHKINGKYCGSALSALLIHNYKEAKESESN